MSTAWQPYRSAPWATRVIEALRHGSFWSVRWLLPVLLAGSAGASLARLAWAGEPHPERTRVSSDRGVLEAARPGTSADNPVDRPRDLTGRSIKTPRVRAIHTTRPSDVGGTSYLIAVDPWLGYQRGRELTLREFGEHEGVYGEAGRQAGPTLEDGVTRATSRDRMNSCSGCHATPWRDMGSGSTISMTGGRGRNTPHLYGAGLLEMLGWQNRLQLLDLVDTNRDGWISFAEAAGRRAYLDTQAPGTVGGHRVFLGRFDDADYDGFPDLDPSIAMWFVDSRGERIATARSLTDPGVAGYTIQFEVFGHGMHMRQLTHAAPAPNTVRAYAGYSFDLFAGLQAFDPTILDEPHHDGLGGVSLAGAQQFSSAALRDRGATRDRAGVSLEDPDRDGFPEELSEGDLDLVEWYLLNHPRPAERLTTVQALRGQELFVRIGCSGCHIPDWEIRAANPGATDYTRRYTGDRRFFDLVVAPRSGFEASTAGPSPVSGGSGPSLATAASRSSTRPPSEPGMAGGADQLVGKLVMLSDRNRDQWVPRRGAFRVKGLYSDLANHDLGEGFDEVQYDGSVIRLHPTAPLWGVGSTAPYGHDGASLDLDAVIRRHGGEAAPTTGRYVALSPDEREWLLAFLRGLVLFGTEDLPCDLDGNGRIEQRFKVAGMDTALERFNPEWLFRLPGKIEGPVTVTDGKRVLRLTSFALVNVDAAYGVDLRYLRDSDGDGFPDQRDSEPWEKGYSPRPGPAIRTGIAGTPR